MTLALIEKSEKEIITLEETKNYLRIDHDFDDGLIKMLIKSTREAMESIIEKPILRQIWQYTADNNIANCDFEDNSYSKNFNDALVMRIPKAPIAKIISVFIEDKQLEKHNFRLENINNSSYIHIGYSWEAGNRHSKIKIVFEFGISENSESVPSQLKLANLMMVANAYQNRYVCGENNVISQGIKQLLNPFLNLRIF